jgi:anti-anti-sigma regulatory factor
MTISEQPKEEEQKRQLYACLDKESQKTFFASFVDQRGSYIDLSSSWKTSRGKALTLMPLTPAWNGEEISLKEIMESNTSFEAHVSRAESRGSFQIRLLSNNQQDIIEEMRHGAHRDNLILEQSKAGMIDILKLGGRVSVESMGRLQSALRTNTEGKRLVLLDLRELIMIPGTCLGVLNKILMEEMEKGLVVNFLIKPDSRVAEEIAESRVHDLAAMHEEYETAVAFLLQSILD